MSIIQTLLAHRADVTATTKVIIINALYLLVIHQYYNTTILIGNIPVL
jgi:hypothetical protein